MKKTEKPNKWAELDAAAANLRALRDEVDPKGEIFLKRTPCPHCKGTGFAPVADGTKNIKQEYFDKVYPKQEKKK